MNESTHSIPFGGGRIREEYDIISSFKKTVHDNIWTEVNAQHNNQQDFSDHTTLLQGTANSSTSTHNRLRDPYQY